MQTGNKKFCCTPPSSLSLLVLSFFFILKGGRERKRQGERERERERERKRISAPIRGQSKSFTKLSLETKLNVFGCQEYGRNQEKVPHQKVPYCSKHTIFESSLTLGNRPTPRLGRGFPERGEKGALSKRLTFLAKHRRKKKASEKKTSKERMRQSHILNRQP